MNPGELTIDGYAKRETGGPVSLSLMNYPWKKDLSAGAAAAMEAEEAKAGEDGTEGQ